ncbi:MAG: hypothetical protein COA58_04800 [Bacteroidetes bacterium]|nr:MAG: hypothetical protein COA58_04800 [Bacteroidota bacterium]
MKICISILLLLSVSITTTFGSSFEVKEYFVKLDSELSEVLFEGENLKQWSSIQVLNAELQAFQTTKINKAFRLQDKRLASIYLISIVSDRDDFIEVLQQNKSVLYAERVPVYSTFLVPNDVHANQWNLAKIDAFNAFGIVNNSSTVKIAIVDDAVLTSHPDLAANIWINPDETLNGLDDDGNGYIDDISGYDVADDDNDASPPTTATAATFSHGTHCAGIASAVTNNNNGIAAIGMNAKIIPIKCKSDGTSGSSLPYAYTGLEYAIVSGCDVISMSWGGGSYSLTYQALMEVANSRGIVLVAAAGNSNVSAPMYPASYKYVISVAASDQNDEKASFSNYGSTIDVTAPGVGIWSTVPGSSAYDFKSGTSMACPLVSGLVALMISNVPGVSPEMIESCLKQSCDNIDAQNLKYVNQLGAGRINAFKALSCQSIKPISNFSGPKLACPDQLITFNDKSVGKLPKTFSWSFPGGSPSASTQQNPEVRYITPGVYSVSLTVSNAFGSDSKTSNDFITVGKPLATISGSYSIPSGLKVGLTIELQGSPPFDFTLNDGTKDYSYSGIYYSPYFIDYGPVDKKTTVVIRSFNDANCSGNKSGSSIIDILGDSCVSVIFNGDFALADNANCVPIGFKTDMTMDCTKPNKGPPEIHVSPNGDGWNGAYWTGVKDHTPGGGTNVLLGDGPSTTSRLWYQFVSVEKGKTYDFSAWFVNANVNGRYAGATSRFEIRVKGVNGPLLLSTGYLGKTTPWTEFVGEYTATETGVIEIDILIIGGPSGGNDFAIDDVSFKCAGAKVGCFKSSNSAVSICATENVSLSVKNGSNYSWYPQVEISSSSSRSVVVSPKSSRYYVCHYTDADDCIVIDSFYVKINPKPSLLLDKKKVELCVGDTLEIVASGADTYIWSPDYRLLGSTSNVVKCFTDINQDYKVIGTNSFGCTDSDTVSVVVEYCCLSRSIIGLASDSIICLGEMVTFINQSKSNGNAVYQWDFGKGAIPSLYTGENPPTVKFEEGGSYKVMLILSDDCGIDTTLQTIHCIAVGVDAGIDSSLCFGDYYKLGGIGISDYSYEWNPCSSLSDCLDPAPVVTMKGYQSYVLTVTDPYSGCQVRDTVNVSELERVKYSEFGDRTACKGDTILLEINANGQQLEWHTGATDSVYRVMDDELVWIKISNGSCDFRDSAYIEFYNCNCVPNIPNAFSPNEDQLNDGFVPEIDCEIENYLLVIYSRWGEKIFESRDPNQRWYGDYKGKAVQMGAYMWVLTYINIEEQISKQESKNGVITVVR